MVMYTLVQSKTIFDHLAYTSLREPNNGSSVIKNALTATNIYTFKKFYLASKAMINNLTTANSIGDSTGRMVASFGPIIPTSPNCYGPPTLPSIEPDASGPSTTRPTLCATCASPRATFRSWPGRPTPCARPNCWVLMSRIGCGYSAIRCSTTL